MNPIYKFELSANGTTRVAYPNYKDDLAIDYAPEQNQEFYRGKLSGKLTFQRDDYLFIHNQAFDTQFDFAIYISYDGGQIWTAYWAGKFWKTDCTFDEDNQTAIVTPTLNDQYNAVLAGLDKEYNLIDLAPVIERVKIDKRPMIQVYVPGQSVIACFLSGMWWEQECDAVTDETALQSTYHFSKNQSRRYVDVEQQGSPTIPDYFYGDPYGSEQGTQEFVNGQYKFQHTFYVVLGGSTETFSIVRVSDNQIMWQVVLGNIGPDIRPYPQELELQPVSGSGASGTVKIYIHDINVWARYVCDVESAMGLTTYPIPDNDIVPNNRNYSRVIGYYFPNTIIFYNQLSTTPTPWGIYQPGQYYVMYQNTFAGVFESFPIARATWGRTSLWFTFDAYDWLTEEYWRKEYVLNDAFPLWSVISVLLGQIAPGITHGDSTDYSMFLYGTNPIKGIDQRLLITPKSNVIYSGYDQPAQKAPITLKTVLDMLRDCFRCYWFIDDQNRFRIEHISWFMNGGTYSGSPTVGIDLTQQIVTRNGKPWAYVRNQYQFDKPEMAARYQFGWMDDVTQLFEGYPIDIVAKFVNPDNIEEIELTQFTSDIDYILLNPSEVATEGFVLLAAERKNLITPETSMVQVTYNSPHLVSVSGLIEGEEIVITFKVQTPRQAPGALGFFDSSNNLISQIYYVPDDTPTTTITVNAIVPANATQIGIYLPISTPYRGYGSLLSVIGGNKLPYEDFVIDYSHHVLQNAWAAFIYLQDYYAYDMPARQYKINGVLKYAQGIKKLKTQNIKFPVLIEPDLTNLIKTELGNGTIQKLSVNLSSRNANATLKYDTE